MIEFAFAEGVVETVWEPLLGIIVAEKAVEEEGEVWGVEVGEGDADDRALRGAGVCVAELDALEA